MEPDYDVYTEYDPDYCEYCTTCECVTGGANCDHCGAPICFDHTKVDVNQIVRCPDCYADFYTAE